MNIEVQQEIALSDQHSQETVLHAVSDIMLTIGHLEQWSSACGTLQHLTSIKMKYRNLLNLEPALILALTKISPRIEVLACQKQA
jgi:hypothetical protein